MTTENEQLPSDSHHIYVFGVDFAEEANASSLNPSRREEVLGPGRFVAQRLGLAPLDPAVLRKNIDALAAALIPELSKIALSSNNFQLDEIEVSVIVDRNAKVALVGNEMGSSLQGGISLRFKRKSTP